jgi:hypothetical protein
MVISRVPLSDWAGAWEAVSLRSYIAEIAGYFIFFTGLQMSRSAQAFLKWLRDEAAG